jgi:nucleolysin TIA-1/TIAR
MWDMNSGKSRGYGFLAFRDKTDAEQAIATMNGEWLGSRAIRVNWANQKTQGGPATGSTGSPMGGGGTAPAPMNFLGGPLSYETVVQQTPAYNTTVYVGNLVPYCTQADLIPLFQSIGYLSEVRMQADRGFAFVKLDTHEHAAMAIVQLQGQMIHGRPIKCSWGKDRADGGTVQTGAVSPTPNAAPYGNMVRYDRFPIWLVQTDLVSAHVRCAAAARHVRSVWLWCVPRKPGRCRRCDATSCPRSCCRPDCARCGCRCCWPGSAGSVDG